MKALQYIYTLCKTSTGSNVGFGCYSKSEGLSDKECEEIQRFTAYRCCKDLPGKGSPTQLQVHPQSFCMFPLSSGRLCLAQSTYLGQYFDVGVEQRTGNYITHALVLERGALEQYPATLDRRKYFRSSLTPEELNQPYPYPVLPMLELTDCALNAERVAEFLEFREAKFALLLSAFLKVKKENLLLFLNDTPENTVLWVAALQTVFPLSMSSDVSFATYK